MGKNMDPHLECALEVCDAVEEVLDEHPGGEDLDEGMVGVLVARLLTKGDRARLKATSEGSSEIAGDIEIQRIAAEAEDDSDEGYDYEDDEDDEDDE
jgi:hypothetical protein